MIKITSSKNGINIIKLILLYVLGFLLFYLEPISIAGLKFSILWKLPLDIFLTVFYFLSILKREKIPTFIVEPDENKGVESKKNVQTYGEIIDFLDKNKFEKTDTLTNVRNIIDSSLGSEWRYWSKNFNWNQQQQTARRLMAQIAGVFSNA